MPAGVVVYVNVWQTATGDYADGRPAGNLAICIGIACDVMRVNFCMCDADTPHWSSLILVPTNSPANW